MVALELEAENKAKTNEADVIVMETRGHTVMGEVLLSSVAHKVIHKSTIPVMLVPFCDVDGSGTDMRINLSRSLASPHRNLIQGAH